MRTISNDELIRDLTKISTDVRTAPVHVQGAVGVDIVVMSRSQYQNLAAKAWDELFETMNRRGAQTAAQGLTDENLEELLADRSASAGRIPSTAEAPGQR